MAEIDVAGCSSSTEEGVMGFEIGATVPAETLVCVASKIEASEATALVTPGNTESTMPSPDATAESIDLFRPDVVLDCTRPRFELVEKKDLATESESHQGETSPLYFTPEADHRIETDAGNNVIDTSQDPTESFTQDASSGCCVVSSIPEAVTTSAFANESQKNTEDDAEAARIKFEPGVKCLDVSQAVEILKTSYRLSDVTIRKNMMTWSCWNISDVIRVPQKETTLWSGRSLPRRKDAKTNEFQGVVLKELSGDEEFHEEMAELCRKIDTRDRELVQILDDILHVAQQNNYDSSTEQTDDSIEVLDSQMTTHQPSAAIRTQSTSGKEQPSAPGKDDASTEDALNKRRNPFARIMRAIRRRFSRRNQTRK